MRFLPIRDVVIVEPIKAAETNGGLYIPQSTLQNIKTHKGKVIAVAPASEDYKPQVKVGDIIMHEEFRITKIVDGDKEYHVMREEAIYTIIEE